MIKATCESERTLAPAQRSDQTDHLPLSIFVLPPDHERAFDSIEQRIGSGHESARLARDRLLCEAEAALGAGPFSVVDDDDVPPSGDRHDYTSLGPYW